MLSPLTDSPLDDVEFLSRSRHRVTVLDALSEGSQSRADLRALTGASPSTMGRLLREFEKRQWIRRDGDQYEATELGSFVASGMRDLVERLETERKLRDVWQWLPADASGFTIGMGSDGVVTVAEAGNPYCPVNRFVSLLRETDRFRFVGSDVALLEPCKDELRRLIVDGMRTEIIDPPDNAEYIHSTHSEHCSAPFESGNLSVRTHDDLPPYGISIFDDRIAISCSDPDSGGVRVLVDTDAPEAREWADATYTSYRRDARPFVFETIVE